MPLYAPPDAIPADIPGFWTNTRRHLEERGVRAPRVVIHGGYGKNNLGDDAILDVLVGRVREHLDGARITVLCHGPGNVARRYRDDPHLVAFHFKSTGAARAIVTSHLYIIGGGGIVNRINVYSGRQRLKLLDMKGKFLFLAAAAAKAAGARTCFYAIGATSFPDPGVRLLARTVLATASVVSVRDPRSLANLQAIGVKRPIVQVLDPALSMTPAPAEEAEEALAEAGVPRGERPRVAIGFRYVRDGSDNDAKVAAVVRLTRHLLTRYGVSVVFVPASHHPSEHFEDDLDFGRRVRAALGDEGAHVHVVERYHHPRLTMAMLGAMDFAVLERLHAVILTSRTEVPFCAVAYDAKVSEYVELIGAGERLITSERFVRDALAEEGYPWLDPFLRAALGADLHEGA